LRFDQLRALDAELKSLASDERAGLVHFLRRLDLLDRERAYAELACRSPFEYLVKELHLAEGTAWRRVNAMQLVRTFPQLESALADGRLNLTTLGILGKLMTPGNVDDLVRRGTHLTKRQAEELAASLQVGARETAQRRG
jgi:hypothetical protein